MINIRIDKGSITISGHADYAKRGYDIVCAAVSVLYQHTINEMSQYFTVKINEDEHEQSFIFGKVLDKSDVANLLIRGFARSVKQIASQYPDNIKVEDVLNDEEV
jgi:uncharacterized protein YsxB (DUF464 family)